MTFEVAKLQLAFSEQIVYLYKERYQSSSIISLKFKA